MKRHHLRRKAKAVTRLGGAEYVKHGYDGTLAAEFSYVGGGGFPLLPSSRPGGFSPEGVPLNRAFRSFAP